MSERYTGITSSEWRQVSNGTIRSMVTLSGDGRVSNEEGVTKTKYAKRKADRDFFAPLGKNTYIQAETGTIDAEVIE